MAVSEKPAAAAAADPVPAADPTAPYAADAAGLFVAMARLNRLVRRKAPAQLGHSAVAVLATVVWSGPLRPSDLAAREGVSAPTMTRVLSGLEAGGYAVREPDPADGRASLVRATAEGAALVQGNRSARSRVLQERIAALSDEQRAALRAALPALQALSGDD
ncbi:MarR family transcriptional regulator [Actinocatenispora thailandica]|uniref:MarR family transcriptional regulator n=1 Tax=Actinocatenispora thailandica TaxID=227318 RepID=A0A7R7DP71_9ACTN|nr:MarR family transcriptional regulator [Actinocatenispora thailandica]BCJ35249.1 MarR family transcriptional regulator [Actinocatenispora thailandica]